MLDFESWQAAEAVAPALAYSYMRRKRWEADILAEAVARRIMGAMPAGNVAPAQTKNSAGAQVSKRGRAYNEIGAGEMMRRLKTRRVDW